MPKPDELLMYSLLEQTHLCGKLVRRFISRGDKPNEPVDNWLSRKRILVQL